MPRATRLRESRASVKFAAAAHGFFILAPWIGVFPRRDLFCEFHLCRLGGAAIATQLEWALGHLCRLRSAALAPPWCFFLNSGHEGGNGGSEDGRGVSEARSTCTE